VLQHEPERAAPAWLTAGETEDEVLGLLKTGKEAEVFVVERRTLDGRRSAILAHKRYRPTRVRKGELEAMGFSRARSFTNDALYHEGRKFRRSRERRAVERMTGLGKRILADRWPAQELETLVTAHEAGVTVPYPVEFTGDGLLMQMLGDDGGVAAPRLVDARLDGAELQRAWGQFVDDVVRLTQAGVVHADLSPYNVLWWRDRLWMIDFPQAVDLVGNPHGFDLLHHDVTTMCAWFTRRGIDCDAESLYADLVATAF
jgi:RIO kinase 1